WRGVGCWVGTGIGCRGGALPPKAPSGERTAASGMTGFAQVERCAPAPVRRSQGRVWKEKAPTEAGQYYVRSKAIRVAGIGSTKTKPRQKQARRKPPNKK